jgi:hypothetical protein
MRFVGPWEMSGDGVAGQSVAAVLMSSVKAQKLRTEVAVSRDDKLGTGKSVSGMSRHHDHPRSTGRVAMFIFYPLLLCASIREHAPSM